MSFQLIDSTTPMEVLENFCREADNDTSTGAVNMRMDDWQNKPNCFLYKLYVEKIYDASNRGGYFLQSNDAGEIISGAGFGQWNLDSNICLLFSRTYVLPKYRKHLRNSSARHFFWQLFLHMKQYDYKGALLTTDDYNRNIAVYVHEYNSLEQEHTVIDGEHYTKDGRKFVPNYIYPKKLMVNYVPQTVLYYCTDSEYYETLLNTFKQIEVDE